MDKWDGLFEERKLKVGTRTDATVCNVVIQNSFWVELNQSNTRTLANVCKLYRQCAYRRQGVLGSGTLVAVKRLELGVTAGTGAAGLSVRLDGGW